MTNIAARVSEIIYTNPQAQIFLEVIVAYMSGW
jgi:hypothetical protein